MRIRIILLFYCTLALHRRTLYDFENPDIPYAPQVVLVTTFTAYFCSLQFIFQKFHQCACVAALNIIIFYIVHDPVFFILIYLDISKQSELAYKLAHLLFVI